MMNYRPYEAQLAASYDQGARQYRNDDEIEAQSENHRRLGSNLRRICHSFARPIRVLEIGCGTGRYFHWLDNVQLLVGTDISAEMLKQAERPLRAHEVTAREIQLVRGSIYEMAFEPGSFDFIYSLGVFGYGAVASPELCANLHRWLSPGGWLYFDAIEVPHRPNFKAHVREIVYRNSPPPMRRWLAARQTMPLHRHSRAQVHAAMERAGFSDFVIASNPCHSPLWNGVHLECSACKSEETSTATYRAARMQFEFAGAAPARSA